MKYTEKQVKYLLQEQRRLCAEFGKHFKFGLYKYKPKDMIENAPEPSLDLPDELK